MNYESEVLHSASFFNSVPRAESMHQVTYSRRMNEGCVNQVGSLNLNYVCTQKESSIDLPSIINSIDVKLGFDSPWCVIY